jgi:putative endonuclease
MKQPARKARTTKARKPAKPACFVYVLGCFARDRYWTYVGWTKDIERRLAQHNAGTGARSTRGRAWVLLHTERFQTANAAMSREWHLKRDRRFRRELAGAHRSTLLESVPI